MYTTKKVTKESKGKWKEMEPSREESMEEKQTNKCKKRKKDRKIPNTKEGK